MTKSEATNPARSLLTILVPVYNEEKTLKQILEQVTKLPIEKYEVIIVNDASHDKSGDIIAAFEKTHKHPAVELKVHNHPHNKGKGAAIQTALGQARGEYFVIQDADLEYNPKDIPQLLDHAKKNNHRVVYGSRFMGDIKGMPKANYYANKFYNFVLRRLYNTAITDMHTCYKLVKTDLLKEFDIASDGFDYATEVVSNILKRNITVNELPIEFNGRTKKEGKKIGYMDGVECTYQLFKYRFSKAL